jgi:hypothetical protein
VVVESLSPLVGARAFVGLENKEELLDELLALPHQIFLV